MCSFSRPSKLTLNCLFLNCQLFIYEQSGYNCWSYLTLFDWLCTTMFNFSTPFSSIFYNPPNFNKITSIHFSWIGNCQLPSKLATLDDILMSSSFCILMSSYFCILESHWYPWIISCWTGEWREPIRRGGLWKNHRVLAWGAPRFPGGPAGTNPTIIEESRENSSF